MNRIPVCFLIMSSLSLFACGGSDNQTTPPPVVEDDNPITEPGPVTPVLDDGTMEVPVAGGVVELSGVAKVTFPANSFSKDTLVKISQNNLSEYMDIFTEFTDIFTVEARIENGVMVEIEAEQPSGNAQVEISLPESFVDSINSGMSARVFVGSENESDSEEIYPYFELVVADIDTETNTITFDAEPSFFSKLGRTQNNFFGLFTVGTTPSAN